MHFRVNAHIFQLEGKATLIHVKPNVGYLLDTQTRGAIVQTMPVTPEELARKAMELPAEGRAELADLLVESLDAEQLSKIDRAWLVEAKRRRDETRAGSVLTTSAGEALRQVRDTLKR